MTLLGTKELFADTGKRYCFSYYRVQTGAGYGVCVADQDGERAVIPEIAAEAKGVDALLWRLMEGGVSPAAVRDVVDDWLIA